MNVQFVSAVWLNELQTTSSATAPSPSLHAEEWDRPAGPGDPGEAWRQAVDTRKVNNNKKTKTRSCNADVSGSGIVIVRNNGKDNMAAVLHAKQTF